MRVSDFSALINIFQLARIDTGSRTLTIAPSASGVVASFEGLHVGAERQSSSVTIDGLTDMIALPWDKLSGVLSVLDEDSPLEARVTETNLILRSGSRRVQIRLSTEFSPFTFNEQIEPAVILDTDELSTALPILSSVSARTIERPVLTGINIGVPKEGTVLLRATDMGRAFAAQIKARRAIPPFDITLQSVDFLTALGVLDQQVHMSATDGGVAILKDDHTIVRISALHGKYPSFASLPKSGFIRELRIPAHIIRLAYKASTILDNDRLVSIQVSDNTLRVLVSGEEIGGFAVDLGEVNLPDSRMRFDGDHFRTAADLGEEVTIRVAAENRPVLMEGGPKQWYWLSPILLS